VPEENEVLLERAVFGQQVEAFLHSEIGSYLINRAQSEVEEALRKLRNCSESELKQIQSEVWRAESIVIWLSQAVEDGLRALNILDGEEE